VQTKFLLRTCVDRLAQDGQTTVADVMRQAKVRGIHRVELRNKQGQTEGTELALKFERMTVKPPIGKQRQYPALTLTVIHAREQRKPRDRERIEWKLVTNLPVQTLAAAVEKLDWYALRWRIEMFHKILKSGCRAEESKLRSAAALAKLIAVFCLISWRVFWLTLSQRIDPEQPPDTVFTKTEIQILDGLIGFSQADQGQRTIGHYWVKVAQLGGYLARASDPPPGTMIMWRGMLRLTDIQQSDSNWPKELWVIESYG
jgi:hypothetical protein